MKEVLLAFIGQLFLGVNISEIVKNKNRFQINKIIRDKQKAS